tara:strand:- start:567 stop:815 length:249 start_codon:yes stop_codon:yes gene_type:complete
MNFEEIALSINQKDKEFIKNSVKENNHCLINFSKYKNDSIYNLFDEWHKIFPRNKQDINCSSCRKAVVKFWDEICNYWNENK